MFIKNADLQHPPRHYKLFLPERPYRGEPPSVAGFLLYPDTPAKMETTAREAFCFRPVPLQDRGKGERHHTPQGSLRSYPTSSRQTREGNCSRDRKPGGDKPEDDNDQIEATAVKNVQYPIGIKSQYQTDFPPPTSCRRRRTPALPQPDNIGINPAFRIEFDTVQRETYPCYPAPVINPRHAGRLGVASSGRSHTAPK